jgi:hypothetical protein
VWEEEHELICEVRDRGHVDQPLVGRQRPAIDQGGGRGLWLINHLCDLAEVRSSPRGTVVRLRMTRR